MVNIILGMRKAVVGAILGNQIILKAIGTIRIMEIKVGPKKIHLRKAIDKIMVEAH